MSRARSIDGQGRIALPSHIREALNLAPGTEVSIDLVGDAAIQIRAKKDRCCFCGEPAEDKYLIGPSEKRICRSCALAIATAVQKKEVG